MRVGLMFPPAADPGLVPVLARRAEAQGFDYFCCGEHVFFHGPITNAFVGVALSLLAELFTGQPVTCHGGFTTIEGQALDPVPVQRPGPPIWVGGRKPPAMRRAARHASVWLPYLVTPRRLTDSLAEVRDLAETYGRARNSVRGAVFCWTAVDRDDAVGRRMALDTVSATYRQDFSGLADAYLVGGNPRRVGDRLAEYAVAGARDLVFAPACPPDAVDRMVDTFATEVLPAIREEAFVD